MKLHDVTGEEVMVGDLVQDRAGVFQYVYWIEPCTDKSGIDSGTRVATLNLRAAFLLYSPAKYKVLRED